MTPKSDAKLYGRVWFLSLVATIRGNTVFTCQREMDSISSETQMQLIIP